MSIDGKRIARDGVTLNVVDHWGHTGNSLR